MIERKIEGYKEGCSEWHSLYINGNHDVNVRGLVVVAGPGDNYDTDLMGGKVGRDREQ